MWLGSSMFSPYIVRLGVFLLVTTFLCNAQGSFNVTDDTFFEIKWPGPLKTPAVIGQKLGDGEEDEENADSMLIHADAQSSYRCYLPNRVHNQKYRKTITDYTGPEPLALLQPLFEQKACSYKIESYWTYELCHGKHLRQYHEEMEGEKTHKKMEFYLGMYQDAAAADPPSPTPLQAPETTEPPPTDQDAAPADPTVTPPTAVAPDEVTKAKTSEPPTISIEGNNFPYFQVNFTGGSICDLTKQPRQVSLLYICLESGRGEIYELVEIESCKYRVVVMSKLLCQHPAYTVVRPHVNSIKCRPADAKSPTKPSSLMIQEMMQQQAIRRGHTSTLEGLFGRDVKIEATREKDRVLIRIGSKRKPEEEGASEDTSTENKAPDADPDAASPTPPPKEEPPAHQQPAPQQHRSMPRSHPPALLLKNFVQGTDCVVGGAGWWRHEFCYSRSIIQYHDDAQTGKRTTIVLGRWEPEKHLKWIAENPRGRPVKNGQFSLFYTAGDRCDETKRARSVEARIRCLHSSSASSTAMAIMLQEPRLCQYILTIESAILCPLVNQVDENGLLSNELNFD